MREELVKDGCPCCFCGALPKIIKYEDNLYYVECSNPKCEKHQKYAYMGFKSTTALDQWNWQNRPIQRISTKKKGKHYEDDNL